MYVASVQSEEFSKQSSRIYEFSFKDQPIDRSVLNTSLNDEKQRRIDELTTDNRRLRDAIDQLKQELFNVSRCEVSLTHDDFRSKMLELEEDNKKLKMQLQFASAPRINELDQQILKLQEQLDDKETQNKILKNRYDIIYTELCARNSFSEQDADRVQALQNEVSEWKAKYNILLKQRDQDDVVQYQQRIKEMEADIEILIQELKQKEQPFQFSVSNDQTDKIETLQRDYEDAKFRIQEQENLLQQRGRDIEILQENNYQLLRKITQLEEQNKRLNQNDSDNMQQTMIIRDLEYKIQLQSKQIEELHEKETFYKQQFKDMASLENNHIMSLERDYESKLMQQTGDFNRKIMEKEMENNLLVEELSQLQERMRENESRGLASIELLKIKSQISEAYNLEIHNLKQQHQDDLNYRTQINSQELQRITNRYQTELQQLQSQIQKLQDQNFQLEEEIRNQRQFRDSNSSQNAEFWKDKHNRLLKQMEIENQSWRQRHEELMERLMRQGDQQREKEMSNSQILQLQQEVQNLSSTLERTREQLSKAEQQIQMEISRSQNLESTREQLIQTQWEQQQEISRLQQYEMTRDSLQKVEQQLQYELQRTQQSLDLTRDQLYKAEQLNDQETQQKNIFREKIIHLERVLSDTESECNQHKREVQTLKGEVQVQRQKITDLSSQLGALETEKLVSNKYEIQVNSLKAERDTFYNQLTQKDSRIQQLEFEIDRIRESQSQFSSEKENFIRHLQNQHKNEIQKRLEEQEHLEQELIHLKQQEITFDSQIISLRAQLTQAHSAIQQLTQTNVSLQQDLQSKSEQHASLEIIIRESKEYQNDLINKKIKTLEQQCHLKEQEIIEYQAKTDELRKKYEEVKQDQDIMRRSLEVARQEVEQQRIRGEDLLRNQQAEIRNNYNQQLQGLKQKHESYLNQLEVQVKKALQDNYQLMIEKQQLTDTIQKQKKQYQEINDELKLKEQQLELELKRQSQKQIQQPTINNLVDDGQISKLKSRIFELEGEVQYLNLVKARQEENYKAILEKLQTYEISQNQLKLDIEKQQSQLKQFSPVKTYEFERINSDGLNFTLARQTTNQDQTTTEIRQTMEFKESNQFESKQDILKAIQEHEIKFENNERKKWNEVGKPPSVTRIYQNSSSISKVEERPLNNYETNRISSKTDLPLQTEQHQKQISEQYKVYTFDETPSINYVEKYSSYQAGQYRSDRTSFNSSNSNSDKIDKLSKVDQFTPKEQSKAIHQRENVTQIPQGSQIDYPELNYLRSRVYSPSKTSLTTEVSQQSRPSPNRQNTQETINYPKQVVPQERGLSSSRSVKQNAMSRRI